MNSDTQPLDYAPAKPSQSSITKGWEGKTEIRLLHFAALPASSVT